MKKLVFLSATASVALWSGPALAAEWYYTWGGFTPVVEAFTLARDIFADVRYGELLYGIALLGVLGGFLAIVLPGFMGRAGLHLGRWIFPVLMGLLIILGFIAPKDDLVIYDPVLNEQREVRNLPVGLVYLASTFNAVEKSLAEIVASASGAVINQMDGGIGFQALLGITGGREPAGPTFRSLTRYVQECVAFELDHPAPRLSVEDLTTNTSDLVAELGKAANPAIHTVVYDEPNPQGVVMTCDRAFDAIRAQLSQPALYEKTLRASCEDAGFATARGEGFQACQRTLQESLSYVYGPASVHPASQFFLGQALVARALERAVMGLDPDQAAAALSNRNQMNAGLSAGIVVNNWLPILRAVFAAVGICIVPVLFLLVPTALGGRALQGIFGMFIFLTLWGICDSLLSGLAHKLSLTAFEDVRNHNMGMTAIMLWPRAAQKALAYFGFVRSSSMTIAVFISTMIVHFGGHALANLASGMMGAMQGQAEVAGQAVGTVEGKARAVEAWRSSIPTMANAARNSFDSDVAARSAREAGTRAGEIGAMEQFGGETDYGQAIGQAAAARAVQQTAHGAGQHDAGLGQLQAQSDARGGASVKGPQQQLDTYRRKVDPEGDYTDMSVAQEYGQVRGYTATGVLSYMGGADHLWGKGENEQGSWTEDGEGNFASASLHNESFRKALTDQSSLQRVATERIANRISWDQAFTDSNAFRKDHNLTNSQTSDIQEGIRREVGKIMSTDAGLAKSLSTEEREHLNRFVGGNAGFGLKAFGMGGELRAGVQKSWDDSKSVQTGATRSEHARESDAVQKLFSEASNNAFQNSLVQGGSESWARTLSKSVGTQEELAVLDSATRVQSISDTQERNVAGALANYVKGQHPDWDNGRVIREIGKDPDRFRGDIAKVALETDLGRDVSGRAAQQMGAAETRIGGERMVADPEGVVEKNLSRGRSLPPVREHKAPGSPGGAGLEDHENKYQERQRKVQEKIDSGAREKKPPAVDII